MLTAIKKIIRPNGQTKRDSIYFSLPSKDKRRIIRKAVRESNDLQNELLNSHDLKMGEKQE